MPSLQEQLDEISQKTRRLVQPERLLQSEALIRELFDTGIEERTLRVGDRAPEFDLVDSATGKLVRSADLLALGPLVVTFFRGRWDPYCVTELEVWREFLPKLRRAGALLVALSPQTLRQGEFTVQQHALRFPLLRDAQCGVADRFGVGYAVSAQMDRYYRSILVSLPFINEGENVMAAPAGGAGVRLPLPATFAVGRSGSILFSEAHADHRVRPEPEAVLGSLLSDKSS